MDEELAAFKNKLTNGKLSKLAVVLIQPPLAPAVIFIFFILYYLFCIIYSVLQLSRYCEWMICKSEPLV